MASMSGVKRERALVLDAGAGAGAGTGGVAAPPAGAPACYAAFLAKQGEYPGTHLSSRSVTLIVDAHCEARVAALERAVLETAARLRTAAAAARAAVAAARGRSSAVPAPACAGGGDDDGAGEAQAGSEGEEDVGEATLPTSPAPAAAAAAADQSAGAPLVPAWLSDV